jgi:hypothetical protein
LVRVVLVNKPIVLLARTEAQEEQQRQETITSWGQIRASTPAAAGGGKERYYASSTAGVVNDLFMIAVPSTTTSGHHQSSQQQQELRVLEQHLSSFQETIKEHRFTQEENPLQTTAAPTPVVISPHHSRDIVPFFPAFPGALSAFSSLLIMYVILHSQKGLKSVYHRILFFMSSADILSSLAMAFHTIPMPPNLPREEEFPEYVFATKRMGNTTTCNIQGFAYLFGIITLFNYNSMLCVYYACAIGLQMDDKRISRIIEPVCHFLVLAIALFYSIPPLLNELYNPSPTEMWCVVSTYPSDCYRNEDVECIRGITNSPLVFDIVWGLAIGIGLNFVIVIVSFTLVISRVVYMDRSVAKYGKTCPENMREKVDNARAKNKITKVVVMQASAYIMAFVITNLFPFINFVTDESPMATQIMTLVFLPLQGFFNFMIFIGHKVYNYRRVNPGVSRCEVLRTFFLSSTRVEEPMYISQLSHVEKNKDSVAGDDEEENEEEDMDSYQDKGPASSPRSMHRDPSAGDAVFFDENSERKSAFSWVANEDGLYSYDEPAGLSRTMSEEDSRSKSTRGEYLSSGSEGKKSSSKSYLSYSIE